MIFVTHNRKTVTEEAYEAALIKVADFYKENALAIRKEDKYASHITEERKDELLNKGLEFAEQVRRGEKSENFSVWQRINYELTGESVPLFFK